MSTSGSSPEVVVAVVALVISIFALFIACLQALQQYFASARGFSQCQEQVIGKWASGTKRRFVKGELRFEVQFMTPVIFVAKPDNTRFPIPDEDIKRILLDGQPNGWADEKLDVMTDYRTRSERARIHTADNERATWTILISKIQQMEKESYEWQCDEYKRYTTSSTPPLQGEQRLVPPPTLKKAHTLTVAFQNKRRSWDTIPSTVAKPYATTTMCHLVEMMAVLGIYWKEFDRAHDRYRGEGNGFTVHGEKVPNLGIMFSFQIYGECKYTWNRVIPVEEIKALCFGYAPTIYHSVLDPKLESSPEKAPQDLSWLQLASRSEIAESLTVLGCSNNTIGYFTNEESRTSHIFPVSFEVLAMLSQTLHIENTTFTYIPNPTPDRWDKRAVSLIKIMEAYEAKLGETLKTRQGNSTIAHHLLKHTKQIKHFHRREKSNAPRLPYFDALHKALNDADTILTLKRNPYSQGNNVPASESGIVCTDEPDKCKQRARRELVQSVLRSHIQVVLRLLNEPGEAFGSAPPKREGLDVRGPSPSGSRIYSPQHLVFEEMNAASSEERQAEFMKVYFENVRPEVIDQMQDAKSSRGRRQPADQEPHDGNLPDSGTQHSVTPNDGLNGRGVHRPPTPPLGQENEARQEESTTAEQIEMEQILSLEIERDDLWDILVFRMICWLMLHDFDKKDVQINKSELYGSRLPVYIA